MPVEAATATEQAARSAVAGPAQPLPPGLYLPSFDHLTQVLARDESFVTVPPGAETEYIRPRRGSFHPRFFAPKEFQTVRRLVEIILGEDLRRSGQKPVPGGPGSIYGEVAEWIDLVAASAPAVRKLALDLPAEQRALAVAYFGSEKPVRELEGFEPERVLREGLAWLAKASSRMFSKGFMHVTRGEQFRLVRSINDDRANRSQSNAGTRLFDLLKRESIRGFYTSRTGLDELGFKADEFHPESPGCALKSNL